MSGGEILFLAHRVPYPPDRGDKIRSWNVLRAMTRIAPVHVCGLLDPADDPGAGKAEIEAIAASLFVASPDHSKVQAMIRALATGAPASVCAFASRRLEAHVSRLLAERPIKTVYAYSGQMAQFVPNALGGRRFVMDFVDMDSAKFASFGAANEGLSGFANRMEAKRLLAFEKRTAARADLSLFVSAPEAILFRTMSGLDATRVGVLENGIDLDRFEPGFRVSAISETRRPLIVFTGQMDYRPNVESVEAFATEVMPAILPIHPDACFAIVGRAPTEQVRALGSLPGMLVTGEVADTRDWLAAADLIVAPLLLARGIQNKVLEAMAMGKPVLASSGAAQGIDAEPGKELFVADGAPEQARAVLDILNDPARAAAIGDAARQRMEARYSWEGRLKGLPAMLGFE